MQKAKVGSQAKIHYTIKLENGQQVGSSKGGMPLSFKLGEGDVLQGLENGVVGMELGERKTIEVPPGQGYGDRNEELVFKLDKDQLPPGFDPTVGRPVQYMTPEGEKVNLMVLDVDPEKETVTFDGNHPLAGQTLFFEVELLALT